MTSAFLSRNNRVIAYNMSNFFIAGTDVGVGKTHVTCCLLRDLKRRGVQAGAFSPVCCGDRAAARLLREAVGINDSLERINPVYLRTCAEPMVAAELEHKSISLPELEQAYRRISCAYSPVLVDGVGAWETPLTQGITMSNFAALLQLPVILVARNQRGAAGLVSMTVRAIHAAGMECRGIILNHIGEEWDTAAVTNRQLIESCTGVPVLAELIHGQEELDSAAVLGD